MQELQSLIKRCKEQDTKAEYALYRECFSILMPVCYRYVMNEDDAADLLNRGFLKILNNLHLYDETKPFDKWIKTIQVNTIIDEFRKNKNHKDLIHPADMNEIPSSFHAVDWNAAESKLNSDDYIKLIQKLPETSRNVFNLFVFEGLDHKEIGKTLAIPEGTSRWHLSNARTLLKKQLAKIVSTFKTMLL